MTTRIKFLVSAVTLAALAPLIALRAQSNYATPYTFTTLAGAIAHGSTDGTASVARFYMPYGIGLDGIGNIYVADEGNRTIRKITPTGFVTTLAGVAGSIGTADGTGRDARFLEPFGAAVDAAGNIYVAEYYLHTIRKITPAGVVTTFAGTTSYSGSSDGQGAAAQFNHPLALAIDASGNVYVADSDNRTIRKISATGAVTTIGGSAGQLGYVDGPAGVSRFYSPSAVAVDIAGNVYVSDDQTIRKITPTGVVSTLAGSNYIRGSNDGTGDAARFNDPRGLAVDSMGNIYVADTGNNLIRKVAPGGVVTTIAGMARSGNEPGYGWVDGTGSAARFSFPASIALDSSGSLYVTDLGNCTVRKITGGVVTTFAGVAGGGGSADGTGSGARFYGSEGMAIDRAGNLYVADSFNFTVRKITTAGVVTTLAGSPGLAGSTDGPGDAARFHLLYGVAVDTSGNVYVSDNSDHIIRKITAAGVVTTLAGLAGFRGSTDGMGTAARFSSPAGLAVDESGNVFVADMGNTSVRKITPTGLVTTLAGVVGSNTLVDGTGTAARFSYPKGLTIDATGNLYLVDNATIRKITPVGSVTTFAGIVAYSNPTDTDGPANIARFGNPSHITVDTSGTVFVADSGNQTIRRITAAGIVTTIAGATGSSGTAEGTGSAVRFDAPRGLAVDRTGNLYVADQNNYTIRKGTVAPAPSISIQPTNLAVTTGWTANLSVTATGDGLSYQWRKNGIVITSNATAITATLTLDRSSLLDAGSYDCVVSNPAGSVTTTAVTLVVNPPSHLVNIATRAFCSTDNKVTIGGFVVSGSTNKRVLVRAVGPSLTAQGIGASEALLDPTIEVHDAIHGNSIVATNDNLADNANAAEIAATTSAIGASALLGTDTKSSALLLNLVPGVYSFVVNGKAGTSGVVLLEVYDADTPPNSSTFTNIATRAFATTGNGVTIGGFVLSGNAPKHVLLRAVGPTLTRQGLGVSEILTDPTIELHDAINGNAIIATNDNWADNPNAASITTTGARIGATPFDGADTASAALLVTLSPGVYSFIAQGRAPNASGIVLVEVYDAD